MPRIRSPERSLAGSRVLLGWGVRRRRCEKTTMREADWGEKGREPMAHCEEKPRRRVRKSLGGRSRGERPIREGQVHHHSWKSRRERIGSRSLLLRKRRYLGKPAATAWRSIIMDRSASMMSRSDVSPESGSRPRPPASPGTRRVIGSTLLRGNALPSPKLLGGLRFLPKTPDLTRLLPTSIKLPAN